MGEGFWIAVIGLAWPLVAIWMLFQFRPLVESLLRRDSITIKVAGFELSSQEAADRIGKDIADLQRRLSLLEAGDLPQTSAITSADSKDTAKFLLWVDDYPSNNAFLIENFRKQGLEVVLSLSTADAVKKLQTGQFDAVISDLGRRENGVDNPLAGLELLQGMHDLERRPPAIIFAGARGLSHRDRLLGAGAEEVTSSSVDVVGFVGRHLRPAVAN